MGKISLHARMATDGLGLPFKCGGLTVAAQMPCTIISVAPLKGQGMAVGAALKKTVKLTLPTVGKVTTHKDMRALWGGQGQWYILGGDAEILGKTLKGSAAVGDQSDAWAVFSLTGKDANAVMARLTPLDISTMEIGQTARSEFAHMLAVITPIPGGYEIMVLRSFAKTAVQHTIAAMEMLSAQMVLK
ncbi:MAG: hypothetical protein V3V13_10535 [Paracoccaceae bacterium]